VNYSSKVKYVALVGGDPDIVRTVNLCFSAFCVPIGIFSFPGDYVSSLSSIAVDSKMLIGKAVECDDYIKSLPDSIPVLSIEKLPDFISDNELLLVAGAYGIRDDDYFLKTLLYCKNKLGLKQLLFHPVYLVYRIDLPIGGYVCSGYPGSGNMIVQKILQNIICKDSRLSVSESAEVARHYAVSYWSSVCMYLRSCLADSGLWYMQTSPTHKQYGSVYFYSSDCYKRSAMVSGLGVGALFWAQRLTTSHEPPSAESIAFFKRYGFGFVFILRNPLDILVSSAAKMTVSSTTGARMPCWLIDNRMWFESMLNSLVGYYSDAMSSIDDLIVVRYEDLLESPYKTVLSLARSVGVCVDVDFLNDVWKKVVGVELSPDIGHYWRPGKDKWLEYIPVEYADVIDRSGIVELAKFFGYDVDVRRLSRKIGDGFEVADLPIIEDIALEECVWSSCAGKNVVVRHDGVSILKGDGVVAVCGSEDEALYKRVLASEIFRCLAHASSGVLDGIDNFVDCGLE
jgi:hypothetical protein